MQHHIELVGILISFACRCAYYNMLRAEVKLWALVLIDKKEEANAEYAIVPEHMLPDEHTQSDYKEEDEDDANANAGN